MIAQRKKKTVLLMVDDDEDDCLLMETAVHKTSCLDYFRCLCDGQELMDYLLHHGIYADPAMFPPPDLILLDLNMPRKDGREALKEIKKHPLLKLIPIVIFSTSKDQTDIELCYNLGVSAYITKPASFDDLIKFVRCLTAYLLNITSLPLSELLSDCCSYADKPSPV